MAEHSANIEPASVPVQPVAESPVKKGKPVLLILIAIIAIIAIANLSSLVGRKGKAASKSALAIQPATASPRQVRNYQALQATEARRDAEEQAQKNQLQQALAQAASAQALVPGPEADNTSPMTAAQRQAIYGDSPNAPQRTSGASQAHAEAKQKELAREKQRQDAFNSDTVAIDFGSSGSNQPTTATAQHNPEAAAGQRSGEERTAAVQPASVKKNDPLAAYPFDAYEGRAYRVFEGTVLEGVVANHIDGGFAGPILVMLTTDYYSHDHQQLLMPQGTRLIGSVQSVGSQGQRKLMVSFHRAVCPDGFSIDFDRYIGLDPIGTTGLASHVDNHILSSFAAAAAIGGLGGLAQIGNAGSILTPEAQLRNGITSQTSQEAEQILNHFLNRLPVITLKEGSRARIYIGRDILIPSYAEHRVEPTL